jgi:4-aminobutyrate aminotransferase/(S)-3-amino-2-methylpropionate transaminase
MTATEIVTDRARKPPAHMQTGNTFRRAAEHGVLLLTAGVHANVIRILVPLAITDTQLDRALGVLRGTVLAEPQGSA